MKSHGLDKGSWSIVDAVSISDLMGLETPG